MGIASKKQAMVIDGMEESNVLYMIDSSSKLARKFTPWIRRFYNALLVGDADEFLSKFSSISRVLKKSAGRMRYEHMSKDQFAQHVMNGIICAFFDRAENTSILHHLAAYSYHFKCFAMERSPCFACIAHYEDREDSAAFSCSYRAVLSEASSECFDHSGRAPIHYVVMRNDLHLVKLLLWYGADVSLRERLTTPLQLAGLSPTTMLICEYLHARVQALQRVFMQWIKKFVRGVWTPHRALSDLHFIRLAKACDWRSDAPRDLVTRNRKVRINMLETHASNPQHIKKCPLMLLFVVPTFYKEEDRLADASNPQIFCATLQNLNGSIVKLLPFQPLLSSSNWSVGIRSALEKPHNGYFYVYKLPDDTYTLHLTVNLEEVRLDASHIALAIQAFACGPPDLRHYNELRGLATLTNKSKLD
ncbi:unnamed protein product [Gongylonema pulchrum]|uniref:ANK_REP_REGION domain-containing protein n=1 Tax=Gongylonema pulchrum TaxID=637853 RepID=A0A183DVC5_9BILA|nr:unnamed protein product [Gongylonema pulchrum]